MLIAGAANHFAPGAADGSPWSAVEPPSPLQVASLGRGSFLRLIGSVATSRVGSVIGMSGTVPR